jgi:hypothetical protein
MKKIIWSVLLILSTTQVLFGQTLENYTHPLFDSIAKDHAVLSILPFGVTIRLRPREMKKLDIDEFEKIEKTQGLVVQSGLYTYFLKKKEKDSFKVSFQDISKTNALLEKAGWTSDSLRSKTKKQICKKLETDGVISGTVLTNKLLSDEASVVLNAAALGVAAASALLGGDVWLGGGGPTNSAIFTINVHEGKKNELLWKYEKKLSRGLGSDINSIINALMRKVSKKFPYEDIK